METRKNVMNDINLCGIGRTDISWDSFVK